MAFVDWTNGLVRLGNSPQPIVVSITICAIVVVPARELDHSQEDGTRHEDHLNADAKQFRRAVVDLKNAFNERNLDNSAEEAHRVLDAASHLEDLSSHHFDNERLVSEWSQITRELSVISEAYGIEGANHGENNCQ